MQRVRIVALSSIGCALISGVAPLAAQTAYSYETYYFSSDGATLYATTYTYGSMSGGSSYQHDYYAYAWIQGPSGSPSATGGGTVHSGYVSAAGTTTVQSNVQISSLVPGSYLVSTRGYAYCTFVGSWAPFYDTGPG